MIEIFGSTTSPFVRRLRMLVYGRDVHFRAITLQQDLEFILKLSPIGKIPILKDGDTVVWDSRQIAHFLFQRWKMAPLSWEDENLLTVISELGDSMVLLYYMKDAGIQDRSNKMVAKHWDRVERLYQYLEGQSKTSASLKDGQWNFVAMTLLAIIDWADFRNVVELKRFPELSRWRQQHLARPEVSSTDPRA